VDISKSSSHSKIIGDFGEQLVCNWLSRSGWEVVPVDHTGIDLIAHNRKSGKRIGITVKSRTRKKGAEKETVNIFKKKNNDREKVQQACKDFACKPWIAVYIETSDAGDLFLTSLANYDAKYRGKINRAIEDWKMSKNILVQYALDSKIHRLGIKFESKKWNCL
jgi:Holliday junction resolvase-like predicted endonuclease